MVNGLSRLYLGLREFASGIISRFRGQEEKDERMWYSLKIPSDAPNKEYAGRVAFFPADTGREADLHAQHVLGTSGMNVCLSTLRELRERAAIESSKLD